MSRLHYLTYNNYYNRLAKKAGDSINDYASFIVDSQDKNHNFNVNDGVYAACTCNSWALYQHTPDYVIVTDNLGALNSRWFVMEAQHMSGAQYKLTLRRDLMADFYDTIMNATAYVEKGYVDASNDLIFNNEGLQLNQILYKRDLLKDKTGVSWITLYTATDKFGMTEGSEDDDPAPITSVTVNWSSPQQDYELVSGGIDHWEYHNIVDVPQTYFGSTQLAAHVLYTLNGYVLQPNWTTRQLLLNPTKRPILYRNISNDEYATIKNYNMSSVAQFAEQMSQNQENAYETIGNNYYSWFEDSMNTSLGYITNSLYTTYTGLNGKLLKDGLTDKFYRVKIVVDHDSEARTYYKQKVALTPAAESKLSSLLTDLGMSYRNVLQGDYTTISPAFIYEGEPYTVTVSLEEVSQGGLTLTTTATNVPKNTPYKIIQIPYCDENGKRASYKINGVARYNDPEVCYGIAQKLIEKLSSTGALYDAQLLPYCLQQTNIVGNILSFNTDQTGTAQVAFINDSDNHHKGIAIYCDTASTEFTINYPWTIENYKIESQTDMLRFCSPTYANCYEINPAKNGGISTVSVSMTAKPHVPYIRVAPNFGRLYGSQFSKDSRGLICAGDFSLPQTTDAWMQFQAQNATFQQSFDRRIENMEVNNSIARKQQKWAIAGNAVAGTANGITKGAMAGGVAGAVIGGTLGAAAGIAGGIADYNMAETLRQESLDYAQDQFDFSLQNIQARPDTLTRVGADTVDNPYFPFVEYYSCSSAEDTALENKIRYRGMTIDVIGSFKDYINNADPLTTYISGRLIKIDIEDDYHLVNEINNELQRGVYV